MIKLYFKSNHSIYKDKNNKENHYRLSIGGKISKDLIYKHFINFPLLGNKNISFNK
jgi:hypothetical protein